MNVYGHAPDASLEQEHLQAVAKACSNSGSATSMPRGGALANYSGTTKDEKKRREYRLVKNCA